MYLHPHLPTGPHSRTHLLPRPTHVHPMGPLLLNSTTIIVHFITVQQPCLLAHGYTSF
ncbi:hypothetical protein Hanom_Chr06g00514651 [Helianthus anomalus]